jgi:glycosyltransferase involved in cell wall biosynthesis
MNEVDVLIPIHGKPIFLEETLNSIADQESINKIYLVLDRVDEDYFKNLNLEEKFMHIEILKSTKPGIVEALNLGLINSKAKYIARIDADDIMQKNRIKIQKEFMEANLNCVCAGSDLEIFETGKSNYIKKYPASFSAISNRMLYQNSIAHPSVIYRGNLVKKVGGYRNFFEGSEDYDLWFRLAKFGEIRNINIPLTKYRKTEGQYSSKFSDYRVKLDSLVRIVNVFSENQINWIDFYESSNLDKILESYTHVISLMKKNNRADLVKIERAEKFGTCLQVLTAKKGKYNLIASKYLLLFCLRYPFFSLRVLIQKIFL